MGAAPSTPVSSTSSLAISSTSTSTSTSVRPTTSILSITISSTSRPITTTSAQPTSTPTTRPTSSRSTPTTLRTSTTSISSSSTSTSSQSTPSPGIPTKNSGRRGLGFNDPTLTAPFSLSGQNSKVSWAYNWASDPYYPGTWTANSYNKILTFVPMLWSAADDLTSIWKANVNNAITTYGADAVLAFNEPDGCCWSCGNSCMNVSSAVSAYKTWVQPYAGKVALGTPAVTNGVGSGVGVDYLAQFMGNCTGCTVDFIPLHWYGSVLDPNSFTSYVQSVYAKFGKPIWVTEFGTTSGTSAQIVTFLQSALPWLDGQSYVKRYAYFMGNNQGTPYLLNTNNTMTDIGKVYNGG